MLIHYCSGHLEREHLVSRLFCACVCVFLLFVGLFVYLFVVCFFPFVVVVVATNLFSLCALFCFLHFHSLCNSVALYCIIFVRAYLYCAFMHF